MIIIYQLLLFLDATEQIAHQSALVSSSQIKSVEERHRTVETAKTGVRNRRSRHIQVVKLSLGMHFWEISVFILKTGATARLHGMAIYYRAGQLHDGCYSQPYNH